MNEAPSKTPEDNPGRERRAAGEGSVPRPKFDFKYEPQTSAEQTASTPKMATRSIRFFYGLNQALFDISLELPENRVTALIGPSRRPMRSTRCSRRPSPASPGSPS